MFRREKIIVALIASMIFLFTGLHAQEKDDSITGTVIREKPMILTPYHWNVIKFNPTPMLIWANLRNITLSYERLVTKDMSVSIQAGYFLFPTLFNDTIGNIVSITGRSKYGVNLAFDYRYYPFSRNRRPAPDGLYIGTYLSYYGFRFSNNIDILHATADQNGALKGKINIVNLGLTLGYQFIFWKRFSLDLLLFGPSLSWYSGNLEITGDLDPDQIKNLDKDMVDKLIARFPFLGTIFSNESLTFTGSRATLLVGFRYSIQLGVHF
jgi:hypothetical protein